MTAEEQATLEGKRVRLLDIYQVSLKQVSPLLKGSMIMAYKRGQVEMLQSLIEGYTFIPRVIEPEQPEPPSSMLGDYVVPQEEV